MSKTTTVSDFFGIGNAIRGAVNIYFRSARQTGRTNALLESLKDGDRVVFIDQQEADRVRRLAKEMDKKIETAVLSPDNIEGLFDRGPSKGRTIFDHSWVERYYLNHIERAAEKLNYFLKDYTGQFIWCLHAIVYAIHQYDNRPQPVQY